MLNPEQIAKIERHLVEVVMGWQSLKLYDTGNYTERLNALVTERQHAQKLTWVSSAKSWHPCSDPAQAAMVREKMQDMGWYWGLGWGVGRYTASFWKPINKGTPEDQLHALKSLMAEAPTEFEASSVAAFLATGGKLEP